MQSLLNLGSLQARVDTALNEMARDGVIRRIWDGDYTLWSEDPTEITRPNRLGWLEVADSMRGEVESLQGFAAEVAAEGYRRAVLFGMGGSSLAPEVMQRTFGTRQGMLQLDVLDTTHPDAVLELQRRIDPDRTLFIVSSKSGSTIETLSQFEYFWSLLPKGEHFIAITDEGSQLQKLGEEHGFRRVFLNRPDIGGRYSALSHFGLVPGALIGADLDEMLTQASTLAEACHDEDPRHNPGALLGAAIGEASLAGRDKLTLLLPNELASFGDWVEQLLAESTGKFSKGIVPIVGEPPAPPASYGNDRLFVAIGEHSDLAALEAAGHPVVRLPFEGTRQLGAEFFRWEFATALAGQRLGINPFDQPNVQSAKDATSHILETNTTEAEPTPSLNEVLSMVQLGDYVALLAYLPRTNAIETPLQALRFDLRDRHLVATTLGFGPRYLHSTGQLHKGGANNGVFVLLTGGYKEDAQVPGRPFSFGRLNRAEALGDLHSLHVAGRRVAHVHLANDPIGAIDALRSGFAEPKEVL
jgi:transaldolase/glucose-6-phosphate isomerase